MAGDFILLLLVQSTLSVIIMIMKHSSPRGPMPCRNHARSRYPSQLILCVYAVYGNSLKTRLYRSNSKGLSYPRFWSGTRQGFPRISWFGKLRAPRRIHRTETLGWGFFFFFFLVYGSEDPPLRNLVGDISDSGMIRQLPLVRCSAPYRNSNTLWIGINSPLFNSECHDGSFATVLACFLTVRST